MKIIIGSRGSKLALIQTKLVKEALLNHDPSLEIEIKIISTKGDRILDKPLNQIDDKGLFVKEIETQLLNKEIDLAVHSLKDMPSQMDEAFCLAKTIQASDANDCIILKEPYKHLDDLPFGATIATGSPRRKAALLAYRNDFNIVGIRGNVETRIQKFKDLNYDGIVLAKAGLKRLGLGHLISQSFDYDLMVPSCGQGILAIQILKDSPLKEIFEKIGDDYSQRRLELERLFLETIDGDCHIPLGCHAEIIDEGIAFWAIYGNMEGQIIQHHEIIQVKIETRIQEIAYQMMKEVQGG